MSESASRELRRDMRRAVGSEALAVIDSHSHALEDIIVNLNALNSRVQTHLELTERRFTGLENTCAKEWNSLNERMDINYGGVEINDQHIKETYAALMAHRDMSFMDRLRWLFIGNR